MDAMSVLLQAATPTPTPSGTASGRLPLPSWLTEVLPAQLVRLVIAIAFVVVAYYAAKLVRQLLGRRIARRFKRPSVSRTILRTIQGAIVIAAVLTALGWLGFGLGNLALSVGVFSAVAGIILAPIIGSVLSGVFILNEQPYEIGDMVELVDTETKGFVEDITLLYTKIFTLDNSFLVLPNGAMRDRDVINYSAEDTRLRMTLDVGVTYESDVEVARQELEAAAREVGSVIEGGPDIRIGSARYPASPTCYIRAFGESEISLRLRYWAQEPYKQLTVQSAVLTNAWRRFDEADIEIPYPHRHMVFDDTSGEMQVATREVDRETKIRPGGATSHESEVDSEDVTDAGGGDVTDAGGGDVTDAGGGDATDSR